MKKVIASLIAAGATGSILAQAVNLNNVAPGYTNDFDSLPSTGTTTLTGNSLTGAGAGMAGWVYGNSNNAGTPLTNLTTIVAENGASTTGGLKSYGATGSSERALGFLGSGTPQNISTGLRLINNTGAGITHITIDFDLEQWRLGGGTAAGANELYFSYRLFEAGSGASFSQADFDSTILNTANPLRPTQLGTGYTVANAFYQTSTDNGVTYTSPTALGLSNGIASPANGGSNTGTAAALDGNASSNKVRVAINILLGAGQDVNGRAITWDPGEEIVLRFADINDTGNDNGLAIDNLSVTPEPGTIAALALGSGLIAARRRRKSK